MDGGFAENMFSGAFALVDRCNNSREQADMVPAALAQARYVVFVQLQPLVAAGPAESGQAASEAATASPATPATAETTAASAAAAGPPAATERLLWLPASSSWLQSLLSRPQVQPVLLGRLRPGMLLLTRFHMRGHSPVLPPLSLLSRSHLPSPSPHFQFASLPHSDISPTCLYYFIASFSSSGFLPFPFLTSPYRRPAEGRCQHPTPRGGAGLEPEAR